MKKDGRLQGKDFINIGIFTAIYFVIVFAVACLGFIPIMMPLFGGVCAADRRRSVYALSDKSQKIWDAHNYGNDTGDYHDAYGAKLAYSHYRNSLWSVGRFADEKQRVSKRVKVRAGEWDF